MQSWSWLSMLCLNKLVAKFVWTSLSFCFEKKVRLLCLCFTCSRYLDSKDIVGSFALSEMISCPFWMQKIFLILLCFKKI